MHDTKGRGSLCVFIDSGSSEPVPCPPHCHQHAGTRALVEILSFTVFKENRVVVVLDPGFIHLIINI